MLGDVGKTYKYRLYPTKNQKQTLLWTLSQCCELYNDALTERRSAYKLCKKTITYVDQNKQLPTIKKESSDLCKIYGQVLQDVLRRVDKSYQRFFLRLKQNKVPGFPRYKSISRYNSFTYPQYGFNLEGSKLKLSKIGNIRIKLHRPLQGAVRTLSIKQEGGSWYACFYSIVETRKLEESNRTIGFDLGIESFLVTDKGDIVDNPRFFQRSQPSLRLLQRSLERKKKGSRRKKLLASKVAKLYRHIASQRGDFQHKLARRLVNEYGVIILEDLKVAGLARTKLAKSVYDVSWSSFIDKLSYKAEEAGRKLVFVDPKGTSQRCPCGAVVRKKLNQRKHECSKCGLKTTRDHASAMEILRLGLSLQALNEGLTSFA